ncbi:DUF2213 domain-containing protein [Pandoraea communis]|uniref:DUF2213 domain-containing protein n=1 Tax=Pandoraea communis TaxID=2508297 RepID=UPI0025A5C15B|nr:DUF2213 domain-containing protein [Pandoraea communis]MDM8357484.1 DUF2213 domain-containing protein [Pandoraea communis]
MTPEGFLLCEDVPIARVGTMDYAAVELPELEDKDGVIVAERTADVLFSPETLASFEGKPVTIDHPPDFVTPANYREVVRGTVRNVRRGEGTQSELMLADLLITDAEAIRQVRAKELTQTSNGYDANYEQIAPGRARQVSIVGNHVALVKSARCGPVCSIGDSASNLLSKGTTDMKTKKTAPLTLMEKLRKAFMTRDSDAFEQAASEMTGDEGGESGDGQPQIHIHMPGASTAPVAATGDEGGEGGGASGGDDKLAALTAAVTKVAEAVEAIGERVTKLETGGAGGGTEDDDDDSDDDFTGDDDQGAGGGDKPSQMTGDSTAVRELFQEARARAEILAPGVNLPTFDAKSSLKKTTDSLCVLRRRALRSALATPNADLVKSVLGGADIKTMTCDSAAVAFNAASELVKARNSHAGQHRQATSDGAKPDTFADINERNRAFWKRS